MFRKFNNERVVVFQSLKTYLINPIVKYFFYCYCHYYLGYYRLDRKIQQTNVQLDTCLCKRIAKPKINYFVFGYIIAQYHANTFEVKNVRACDSEKLQVEYIINDIRSDGKYNTGSLLREITQKLWVINKGTEGHYGNKHKRWYFKGCLRKCLPKKIIHLDIFNKKQKRIKHHL